MVFKILQLFLLIIFKPHMKIELISKSQCRYVGTLKSISNDITIEMVRSYGTENREAPLKVEKSPKTYQYITFKLHNLKAIKIKNRWHTVPDAVDILSKSDSFANYDSVEREFNPEESKKYYNYEKSFYDDL